MSSILNFVITRFNLRAADDPGIRQLNPVWLERRFELFDQFCFPTVRSQTFQDFEWLVLFDSATPAMYRDRIDEYANWKNFVPIYYPPGTEQVGRKAVRTRIKVFPDLLVTTRLDNDDGICRNFIESVQAHVRVSEPTVIEFPVGYVWHKNRIYRDRQLHNPFTSLVEPLYGRSDIDFRTIYSGSHTDASKLGGVVIVAERPSWLQVIHEGNLENRERGIRCGMRELSNDFAIKPPEPMARENWILLHLDKAFTTLRTTALKYSHHIRSKLYARRL